MRDAINNNADTTTGNQDQLLTGAARAIINASNIVLFSGAGISAESGINTFRDPEMGVWKNKIGLALFGTPFGWKWIPGYAWSAYKIFRGPISKAQPNPGHYAVRDLQLYCENMLDGAANRNHRRSNKDFCIITQNVDALHQRAGNDTVYELHGSVYRHRCIKNGHINEVHEEIFAQNVTPRCTQCSSNLRPDATLFTEALPADAWAQAETAIRRLNRNNTRGVLIVVGTSGVVYPAASLPEIAAGMPNVTVIEVNPEPSTYTRRGLVDFFLQGPGGDLLPKLMERVKQLEQQLEQQEEQQ